MADAPHPPGETPDPSTTWIASRLQARFDGLDTDPASVGGYSPPSTSTGSSGIEPGAVRTTGVTDQGFPRATDRASQRQIDDINRQLEVLRDQLDAAFDELDQRLEAAETRASVAEARASVAEARASVAETRAADAEARANQAHTRIDEVIELVTERDAEDRMPASDPGEPANLRSALDRLRDRLDVG